MMRAAGAGPDPGPDRVADRAGSDNGLWGRGPQLFLLMGVPAQGKTAQQVEDALKAQVARIAREGITAAELARVKTQWVAGEVYKLDSLFNQARELGTQWAQGLGVDAGDQLMAQLRAVTAEQVQSVAQRYFGDDALTVATLLPQPPDKSRKLRAAVAGIRHRDSHRSIMKISKTIAVGALFIWALSSPSATVGSLLDLHLRLLKLE